MRQFSNKRLNRRFFLRGTGTAAIALPFLDAMTPAVMTRRLRAEELKKPPHRFVAACATLGFHGPALFPNLHAGDEAASSEVSNSVPKQALTESPYLKHLKEIAGEFTLFSGLSHPEQQGNNGHASEMTWLTSAQRPGLAGFKNTISIDQVIAREIGLATRYPYLALSTSGRSMSWSSAGVEIPGQTSPTKLFKSLFVSGSEAEVAEEMQQLRRGRSILDTVQQQARRLNRTLGEADQAKLDEYLTAVRDLESRLQQNEGWVTRPKPEVNAEQPQDINDHTEAIARQELMYDMIVLAFQTDSTRTITFQLGGLNAVPQIPGVKSDWHNLSHHGKNPEKIEELKIIEEAEFAAFGRFLTKLRLVQESGTSLLNNTAVLYGSNLGNASSHDWHNLPILLAGGQFKHTGYVVHDQENNTPLANLFVPLAQRMGVDIDQFGSSTSAGVRGIELS